MSKRIRSNENSSIEYENLFLFLKEEPVLNEFIKISSWIFTNPPIIKKEIYGDDTHIVTHFSNYIDNIFLNWEPSYNLITTIKSNLEFKDSKLIFEIVNKYLSNSYNEMLKSALNKALLNVCKFYNLTVFIKISESKLYILFEKIYPLLESQDKKNEEIPEEENYKLIAATKYINKSIEKIDDGIEINDIDLILNKLELFFKNLAIIFFSAKGLNMVVFSENNVGEEYDVDIKTIDEDIYNEYIRYSNLPENIEDYKKSELIYQKYNEKYGYLDRDVYNCEFNYLEIDLEFNYFFNNNEYIIEFIKSIENYLEEYCEIYGLKNCNEFLVNDTTYSIKYNKVYSITFEINKIFNINSRTTN